MRSNTGGHAWQRRPSHPFLTSPQNYNEYLMRYTIPKKKCPRVILKTSEHPKSQPSSSLKSLGWDILNEQIKLKSPPPKIHSKDIRALFHGGSSSNSLPPVHVWLTLRPPFGVWLKETSKQNTLSYTPFSLYKPWGHCRAVHKEYSGK